MFFRKGQALGSVQVTDSGEPDETKAVPREDPTPEPEPEPVAAPEPAPTPKSEVGPPKVTDLKADWIEFAVSKGMDRELAEDSSTTKQDLIDSYGG